jgi:hypothetical protein
MKQRPPLRPYHHDRNHLSLDKDAPYKRPVQVKPKAGKIIELQESVDYITGMSGRKLLRAFFSKT